MSKRLLVASLITLFFMVGMQWLSITPAYASTSEASSKAESPFYSEIRITDTGDLYQYKPFFIHGTLTDWNGVGLGEEGIIFNFDGEYFAATQTNTDGSFQILVEKQLPLGNHKVDIYFTGTDTHNSSTAAVNITIQPNVELTLAGTRQSILAEPIVLSGVLRDIATGTPIPDSTVKFSIHGEYIGQAPTGDKGAFYFQIHKDLPVGNYPVIASFNGAHLLAPAFAEISFEILPATFRVQTVPAISGITFEMDGRQFVSGHDGIASLKVDQPGEHNLEILLDQYHNSSFQIEFGRWKEETYETHREVRIPEDDVVQVGLNVYHKVSFKFTDLDGLPVDPSRIEAISIRSTQGDTFTLKPGDTPWLPASRTARYLHNLEETDLLYSVNSVTMDGSNVVNSAQQRFYAKPDDIWNISLLLYSMHITSRDGLFAAPVGKSIDVLYPNGQIKNFLLDKSGNLEIHALARGIYHVSLVGIKGLGTSIPVALSRNQDVNLKIVTTLDMAVVGLIALSFGVGLIIFGRPWLWGLILGRNKKAYTKMEWASRNDH